MKTKLNSNRDLLKSNNYDNNANNSENVFVFLPKLKKNKKYKKNKIKKNYIEIKSESKINNINKSDIILDDYLETEIKDMAFYEVIEREKIPF